MYIDDDENKKPIAFADILNAKVFKYENAVFLKATFEDKAVAVDLTEGKVVVPSKDDFKQCFIYPGATLKMKPSHRKLDD